MTAKGFAVPSFSKAVRCVAIGVLIRNHGNPNRKCCFSVKNVQAVGAVSKFAKLAPLNWVKEIAANLIAENAPLVFGVARFARQAPESKSARL